MPRSLSLVRRAIGYVTAVALLVLAATGGMHLVTSSKPSPVAIIVCDPCPVPPQP